jgi:uncharacterized protein YdhG (YjbR/CyaY superfamily)
MEKPKPVTVAEYIATFPIAVQEKLEQMRAAVKEVAPDAEESLSYGIIGYKHHSKLIWFSANKKHIGVYPIYGLEKFETDIAPYIAKRVKSSLHFSYTQPLPLDLIKKMVLHRIEENLKNK